MKKCFLFGFCSVLIISCSAYKNSSAIHNQPNWNDTLSVEQNIAKNAVAFQNNDEFYIFDGIVKTKSLIILGEMGHNDSAMYDVKTNMVNYLRTKGFNSIAFESAAFLSAYVFSNSKYNDITKDWKIEHFCSLLQGKQELCKSLFDAIYNRDLKLYGIDSHLGAYDILAAKALLADYFNEYPIEIDWDKLNNLYLRYFFNHSVNSQEQYELMRMIDTLSNYTHYIISQKGRTIDLSAILQWIRNINTGFAYVKYNQNPFDKDKTQFIYRNRDAQMAENIIWLTKNYPKEKLTVWCANFHGAKDISQTTYPTDSLLYFIFQSMGESLYNELGETMYSLAITSLNPNISDRGVLESEISVATNDAPFAFVNFVPLRCADGYRDKQFDCEVIMKKRGKWLYLFDGIYYIKTPRIISYE